MNEREARQSILALLKQKGRCSNSEMLALVGHNRELLERICEELILEDLANDKAGVGLVWKGTFDSALSDSSSTAKSKLFLSYGRRDAKDLADRLGADLRTAGFEVWQDLREITAGEPWQSEIVDGLRSAQVVIALLSPHSVRVRGGAGNPDAGDSVCLGEIAYALYNAPPRPVVPVMAAPCEAPLCIFHLDHVDLCRWRDSESQYQDGFQRLLDGIGAALRGERRYRSWHDQLNPWDFAAYLNQKRRDFAGREWLFEEIDAWRVSSNDRALLITGDPGIGKSAIVAQLVHLNPGGQVIAYHCCQADTQATLEPWRIVRSLAAMIASRVDAYAAQLDDPNIRDALSEANCRRDPGSAFEEGVLRPLEALPAPPGGTRYLLIDALDEGLSLDESKVNVVQLLATRIDRMPGWLKILATTRKEPEVLSRLAALRAKELDAHDSRNLDDIARYLAARLRTANLAEALAHSRLPDDGVIRALGQKSEGNFLYAQQALDGIERGKYRLDELDRLPPGLFGLYQTFFERTFPDESTFAPARQLLEVILAASEPLDEEQLAAACGLDTEAELPRALQSLSVYLTRRTGLGERQTYSLFHKSLEDWLTHPDRRARLHSANRKRGHRRLADRAWPQYASGTALSPYVRRSLPGHLVGADRWGDLEALLTDLKYLESRNAAGEIFSLVADFREALAALPSDRPQTHILRLLEEALLRDIHFIDRHREDYPQGLFQCLWNSCWWHDCPQAAQHYEMPENGWPAQGPPWGHTGPKLYLLMEQWRADRERIMAGFVWVRSHRPPTIRLGTVQRIVLCGHEARVQSVSFFPDGRRIASVSEDCTVRVWDTQSGKQLTVLRGHSRPVNGVSFSSDGRRIASGGWDGIRVWDAESGAELALLRGRPVAVMSVSLSSDGRRIVDGSIRGVRVWDVQSGAELALFRVPGPVSSVSFSPDGRRIASVSEDRMVRVWDALTGAELLRFLGHEGSRLMSVSFSPDGRRIASGAGDATVRVWDAESGAELAVLRGHDQTVTSVSFSKDGRRIASGSWDATVRVWDAESGAELAVLRGHDSTVTSVSFSKDGRFASASKDLTVRVWDIQSGTALSVLRGYEHDLRDASFSPDGRLVASVSDDRTVRVWDAESGVQLRALRGHSSRVATVSFCPDSRRLASSSFKPDNTVRVWDACNGAELAVFHGRKAAVMDFAFSRDGRHIASALDDGTVRVWDTRDGTEVAVLRGEEKDEIRAVSFSADGRRIAAGSYKGTVCVWDAESGAELAVLRGHESLVREVSFSADGRRIASGSNDETARVWDAESGAELAVLRGHESLVTRVSFSADGRRIATESWDGTVRVWDAGSGECLSVIDGYADVEAIAAGPLRFPFRAVGRRFETVIQNATAGSTIAWYARPIAHFSTAPFGQAWAASPGGKLDIFSLELAAIHEPHHGALGRGSKWKPFRGILRRILPRSLFEAKG